MNQGILKIQQILVILATVMQGSLFIMYCEELNQSRCFVSMCTTSHSVIYN